MSPGAAATLGRIFLLLAGGGALLWLLAPFLATALLYLPDRSDLGAPPILAGVPGEVVHYAAADGTRLLGWWYGAAPPASARGTPGEGSMGAGTPGSHPAPTHPAPTHPAPDNPAPTHPAPRNPAPPAVLFFHGNAGHLGDRAFQAEGMLREGVSVFLAAYRGYGGSEGRPSPGGHLQDARAALDWLAPRLGGEARVVLHGRSLGGAVAASLAAERPGVGGLVLESTFTDMVGMARAVYPFLPPPLLGRLRGMLDTEGAVAAFPGPVLVVHGTEDALVPFAMGSRLHQRSDRSRFLPVEGAGHNDLPLVGGAAYFREVAAFARSTRGERAPRRRGVNPPRRGLGALASRA